MAIGVTPLTYNGYINQIATMAVVNTTTVSNVVQGVDAAFNAIIPQMLNYAELRIQRDLDLLPLQSSNTYALIIGNNILTIPTADFVVTQTMTVTSGGVTVPLLPTTKEFLQNVYGAGGTQGTPIYYTPVGGDAATGGNTSNLFMVGPYPDLAYPVTIYGTSRAPTLYAQATTALANTGTTFISTYFPDLLIMASMIYISAYQRNFGRMSDDPAMAQSYESQYTALLPSAGREEYQKKYEASAWSSMSPAAPATPTR